MEFNNSDIVFAASSVNNKQEELLHPVFGLWKTYLCDDLRKELERGVRKVTLWSERHKVSSVPFANELEEQFLPIKELEEKIELLVNY